MTKGLGQSGSFGDAPRCHPNGRIQLVVYRAGTVDHDLEAGLPQIAGERISCFCLVLPMTRRLCGGPLRDGALYFAAALAPQAR